jgi:hypothetical protein
MHLVFFGKSGPKLAGGGERVVLLVFVIVCGCVSMVESLVVALLFDAPV